ncbi:MAG: family N-acetyltransferase [Sphingobacteriaceae bacterium]|jgi:GNAT superfamily N-acetyltransferase|nr:family N-acetyltransferase [Sphingobacteriaceae bacterium]
MLIRPATDQDIPVISRLANEIWWPTYGSFISHEQISFMLENMYSEEALRRQMKEEGISFLMAEREGEPVAFAGFSETEPEVFKLHKLYILPSEQGKGTGKRLIEHVEDLARAQGGTILELNVNRANPAFGFYKKLGFRIYQTVDIPYHQFVLNDYVMRKGL